MEEGIKAFVAGSAVWGLRTARRKAVHEADVVGDVEHRCAGGAVAVGVRIFRGKAVDEAREILKYEPTVLFEEGLSRTLDWYRESQAKALAKQKSEA